MRIYEIAKLLNISNKELIDFLAKKGFDVKSHMSALSEEAIKIAQEFFSKKDSAKRISQSDIEETSEKPALDFQEKKASPALNKKTNSLVEKKTEIDHDLQVEIPQKFLIEPMTVADFAQKAEKPVSEVIMTLLRQGIVSPKNQLLPEKTVEMLAKVYNFSYSYPVKLKKEERRITAPQAGVDIRLPVVVVLGHVDHGKTTLLDFIRKTRVAQKEKGGITQHLGAYQVETAHGRLVFLDTPGHEAFSNIRGRGVNVADLAILVVAADDSIMPQTIEAITKAKKAGIPIVVAVNKIDKVEASRLEVIRNDLARYDLLPEEWGGETIVVPISAKLGTGVDKLLELVALQAQLMDLRTNVNQPASGFILESKLQKGLGPVATVVCQQGTLRIGDHFCAGYALGKVSSLINSYGVRINEVGPSIPVQVSGFSELPHAGDQFEVISQEKYKKLKSAGAIQADLESKKRTGEDSINVIIKTDTSSSKEALLEAIKKISDKSPIKSFIVHAGIGDINESDVVLAANTGSIILGLHIKTQPNATISAQQNIVRIMLFDIIYKLLEHLEALLKKEEPVKMIAKKIGEAVIRKVFHIKNVGVIAGAYCKEGIFSRTGRIVAWRGKEKIGEGLIKSLERDRKSVKEIHAGFEFAFLVEGVDDWQIDDRAECYIEKPEENKSQR
jgi:translation initiation factor IF-2